MTTRNYTSEPLLRHFQILELSSLAKIVKLVQLREQKDWDEPCSGPTARRPTIHIKWTADAVESDSPHHSFEIATNKRSLPWGLPCSSGSKVMKVCHSCLWFNFPVLSASAKWGNHTTLHECWQNIRKVKRNQHQSWTLCVVESLSWGIPFTSAVNQMRENRLPW